MKAAHVTKHAPVELSVERKTFRVQVDESEWEDGTRSFHVYDITDHDEGDFAALTWEVGPFKSYPTDEQICGLFRMIRNTDQPKRMPWPEDAFVQGGGHGLVFVRGAENYTTAFVEASPGGGGTFIRGEGTTIEEAEKAAWVKWERWTSCKHEWIPGKYTNGAGICKLCDSFGSRLFTGEQLGQFCKDCGVGTTWSSKDGQWTCEEHTPPYEGNPMEDLFEHLAESARDNGDTK